jgi:hypothetical protein
MAVKKTMQERKVMLDESEPTDERIDAALVVAEKVLRQLPKSRWEHTYLSEALEVLRSLVGDCQKVS